MGHRCCSKQKVKKGLWSPEEDEKLLKHITTHGHGSWSSVPKLAGLQRCGKSCRLRWINYLRPDLRRGSFSEEEEQIIIDVHRILGNRWAQIAKHLPGRTDNEVKNFWNSCIKKKLLSQGLDPKTHNLIPSHQRAAKKAACNLSQSFDHQPICLFNVNNAHMTISNVSAEIIRPPILTLPSPHPLPTSIDQSPLLPDVTTTVPTSEYQSTDVWDIATCTQSSLDSTSFPCVSSVESWPISSSYSTSVHPSRFGSLIDDNDCIWGANTHVVEVEAFRAPGLEGTQVQEHDQQLDKLENNMISSDQMKTDHRLMNEEAKGVDQEMDCSFDSSSFDLEFVESTLMSGGMCRDLGSISMDEFTWDF